MGVRIRAAVRRRCQKGERGAVLVEAAIAIPLLLSLIFGALEAGMAWEAKSSSTAGLRTGLLRAASIADKPETDLRVLQSIVGEIGGENVANINWIVIFDASGPDPVATMNACAAAGAGGGISGQCNTYVASDLVSVVNGTWTVADFDDGSNGPAPYTCDVSKVDSNWCAPSRTDAGPGEVGVGVSYDHDWFTGALPGDGVTFTDFSVSTMLAD
jgi:hypothetical protein